MHMPPRGLARTRRGPDSGSTGCVGGRPEPTCHLLPSLMRVVVLRRSGEPGRCPKTLVAVPWVPSGAAWLRSILRDPQARGRYKIWHPPCYDVRANTCYMIDPESLLLPVTGLIPLQCLPGDNNTEYVCETSTTPYEYRP
ncbi:hypothetical protein NDU88_004662 [Pleurodeles waltl]|uniref:Uncharacterized protein n=1 Tax=Pleurodeles waltl TaxID=8319 RepID=A0AAV7PEQ6_PLEWA|nr:hypothetical protein NDU88_004662 [Pleurodeles waltl]